MLTAKQVAAVRFLTAPLDERGFKTEKAWCDAYGITDRALRNWKHN